MAIADEDVDRFASLFQGNKRSYGQFVPQAEKKQFSVNEEYTIEHIRSHLEGHVGIGLGPIQDDNTCLWGAIDIDVHGPNGQHVDIEKVAAKIDDGKMPLVACRSKSGGVHCYIFFKAPTEAARVRMMLTRWSTQLGFPTAEIFPKQITLAMMPHDIERPKASWINLPYFAAEETNRWAMDGGKQVTFDYFLSLVEAKRIDLQQYETGADIDYIKGPPCLQEIIKNKIEEGSRNVAVFQAAVYLKRAFPSDWKQRVTEFNAIALHTPLEQKEMRTIFGSVNKRDYQYKCREEPCKGFCNRDLCKTREFGITDKDQQANDIPLIEKVEKVIATPIRWDLTVKGQIVSLTTAELFSFQMVRQRVGEKLHLVLPRIKDAEWDLFLREIMAKVEVKEEMTQEKMIFSRICEYVKRARDDTTIPEDDRREDLRRGMPALLCFDKVRFAGAEGVVREGERWYFAFKIMSFIDWMRQRKILAVPDHQVYSILTKLLGEDAKRSRVRVGKGAYVGNVWCVAKEAVDDGEPPVPEKTFKSEF